MAADLDPLGLWQRPFYPELDFRHYGFTEKDLNRQFYVGNFPGTKDGFETLGEIINRLKSFYSHNIGVEYMHIQDPTMKAWVCARFETTDKPRMDTEKKRKVFEWLVKGNDFELFLADKYRTAKRFGLEGCESLIPGLEAMLLRGTEQVIPVLVRISGHFTQIRIFLGA